MISYAPFFKIKDLKFTIGKASLTCTSSVDGVRWTLSIQAVAKELDGEKWAPRAYSERLIGLAHLEGSQVQNVSGLSLVWADCYEVLPGIPHASLYVFEHADIYDSTMVFGAFDGLSFEFEWNAKCDVFWGRKYEQGLSLHIKTKVEWVQASYVNP